jgi:hypothetical protein
MGFGDSVEPNVEELNLSVLLNLPALGCEPTRTRVVTEKFQAMEAFGNTTRTPQITRCTR